VKYSSDFTGQAWRMERRTKSGERRAESMGQRAESKELDTWLLLYFSLPNELPLSFK